MQPCEALLPMLPGLLVPWMPNCPHGTFNPRNRVPKPPRSPEKRLVRRIARAGRYGVTLFDLRALVEGEGLLRNVNPDPGAFRHVGAAGALLRSQLGALSAGRRGGQTPGPRQQRAEQKRRDRPYPCSRHVRAPFALVLQPYAPPVSDMPCADGYVSHKKSGAHSKRSARRK